MAVLKRSFVGRCFPHSSGEVGLGVGAIARPHPINDPDHPHLRGENQLGSQTVSKRKGSSLLARGKILSGIYSGSSDRIIPA